MLYFRKLPVAKTFRIRKGGGSIRILRPTLFVSQCQKTSKVNFLVCHSFRVSKNFMLQRLMSRFSSEKILSHSAGKFRREPFCAVFQKKSGSENFSDKKGVGASGFSVQFFFITVPKNFIDEPFSVSLISGIEKLYASEGHVTIFPRKFFVSQCRKSPKRNRSVLCFSKFPVAKNFWIRRGGASRFSVENFFVSQCRNIS